jgi:prepilin-type N-terminal cleavage/methylation domain-containing protein
MSSSRGFSLIETILALAILCVALIPLMAGMRNEVVMNSAGSLGGRMALSAASVLERARLTRHGPACLPPASGPMTWNRVLLRRSAVPSAAGLDLSIVVSAALPGRILANSLAVQLRCGS